MSRGRAAPAVMGDPEELRHTDHETTAGHRKHHVLLDRHVEDRLHDVLVENVLGIGPRGLAVVEKAAHRVRLRARGSDEHGPDVEREGETIGSPWKPSTRRGSVSDPAVRISSSTIGTCSANASRVTCVDCRLNFLQKPLIASG